MGKEGEKRKDVSCFAKIFHFWIGTLMEPQDEDYQRLRKSILAVLAFPGGPGCLLIAGVLGSTLDSTANAHTWVPLLALVAMAFVFVGQYVWLRFKSRHVGDLMCATSLWVT